MVKRYLVFKGHQGQSGYGWDNFVDDYGILQLAIDYCKDLPIRDQDGYLQGAHVVDTETKKIIYGWDSKLKK